MNWGELRKSKLAKPGLRDLAPDPAHQRHRVARRAAELWGRFGAFSLWEQAAVLGVALIALIGIPVIVLAFSGSLGGETSADQPKPPGFVLAPTSTPTAVRPTETQLPSITPKPTGTEEPEILNREDCDAIAGTPYLSEEEQLWYLENCPAPTDEPPGGGGPPTQPPPPPAPTPTPSSGMTAAQAISRAVSWLASQGIEVDSGSCSASRSGGGWLVSCAGGGPTANVCIQESPVVIYLC